MNKGPFLKLMSCSRCKRMQVASLQQRVFGNGVAHFFWQCTSCQHSAEGPGVWISKGKLSAEFLKFGITERDVPVWKSTPTVECAVAGCTEIGAENHHIAPRAIFHDDADLWPTVRLCGKHHAEWHLRVWPGDIPISDAQWEAIKAEMRRESQQAAMEGSL